MSESNSGISAQRLKSFVQRIERLEEEKKAIGADIREVYSEAKSSGFDAKIIRKVIALRKLDDAERQEMEALLTLYLDAIGDYASTPMGRMAVAEKTVEVADKVRKSRAGGKRSAKVPTPEEVAPAETFDESQTDDIVQSATAEVTGAESAAPVVAAEPDATEEPDAVEPTPEDAPAPAPATEPDPTFNDEAEAEESAYQRVQRLTREAKEGKGDDDGLEIPGFLKRSAPTTAAASA